MKYRKLLFNLLASLAAPLIFFIKRIPDIYVAIVSKQYKYQDYQITSLKDYLHAVFEGFYLWLSLLSLILIFVPFQLIKDYCYKKKRALTFLQKVSLLTLIMAIWLIAWGLVGNIWFYPVYYNLIYIGFSIFFGLLFAAFFYLTVDKYAEIKL